MATLSPFQKLKYSHLFEKFYDANKNGVITLSDFLQMVSNLKEFRNWGPNDTRLHLCEQTLNQTWSALKCGADVNEDQEVNLAEWYDYWAEFVEKSKKCEDGWPAIPWVREYMKFWFDFLDTSGDGLIDEKEFVQVCSYFDIPEEECHLAFQKLGTRPVDKDYFAKLWLQYMTSDKKSDPGNYIFGKAYWDDN